MKGLTETAENTLQKNADRFKGFADVYDSARPKMPTYPVKIIKRYLGRTPETVVDLGCGTGLSTLVWRGNCKNAIGVEPSGDMLFEAQKKAGGELSFVKAFSDNTTLESNIADVVVCSQSFHWMEPVSTLNEVSRILKDGGVFATVDCDWPPVCVPKAEKAYMELYKKVKRLEKELPDVNKSFVRYPKDKHLENIKNSGHFYYCRELLFSNSEEFDANRFIGVILSQGSLQTVLRLHPELIFDDIEKFKKEVFDIFGGAHFEADFCYRMRIGVK